MHHQVAPELAHGCCSHRLAAAQLAVGRHTTGVRDLSEGLCSFQAEFRVSITHMSYCTAFYSSLGTKEFCKRVIGNLDQHFRGDTYTSQFLMQ